MNRNRFCSSSPFARCGVCQRSNLCAQALTRRSFCALPCASGRYLRSLSGSLARNKKRARSPSFMLTPICPWGLGKTKRKYSLSPCGRGLGRGGIIFVLSLNRHGLPGAAKRQEARKASEPGKQKKRCPLFLKDISTAIIPLTPPSEKGEVQNGFSLLRSQYILRRPLVLSLPSSL